MEEFRKVRDYNVGETFEGYLLVQDVQKSITKNGDTYLRVKLVDKSGEIVMMVWEVDEEVEGIFREGEVVAVRGVLEEYRGELQIKVELFRGLEEDEEVDVVEFLDSAPRKGEDYFKYIKKEIGEIENKILRELVEELVDKYKEEFKVYPAARNVHHNYISGLIYHTSTMLQMAKYLCRLYKIISKDLLVAGVILHDLGKVVEYTGGNVVETTLKGKLKGHITIINEELRLQAERLGYSETEELLLLQHMILSHHGKREWGSPVEPLLIEAQMLHQLDVIDMQVDSYRKEVKNVGEREFTGRIFGLGDKELYNHGID